MTCVRLPRASKSWSGGFVITDPQFVGSISAGRGTVVGAGEALYLLRPGAASLVTSTRMPIEGDAVAVAVEPRRPTRVALAGMDSVTILKGSERLTVRLPESHPEPVELAWGPSTNGSELSLYVLFDVGEVLRLVPERRDFEELTLSSLRAIAADASGRLALARFDEGNWELDVGLLENPHDGTCSVRSLEAPDVMSGVRLAVAGSAVAVSFEFGAVWISRKKDEPFREVAGLAGGAPVAFQGATSEAALFGVARNGDVESLVRVDADGEAARFAEVKGGPAGPLVRQLAWDESRSSLWGAGGHGGVLLSTAPGVKVPLGAHAAS